MFFFNFSFNHVYLCISVSVCQSGGCLQKGEVSDILELEPLEMSARNQTQSSGKAILLIDEPSF